MWLGKSSTAGYSNRNGDWWYHSSSCTGSVISNPTLWRSGNKPPHQNRCCYAPCNHARLVAPLQIWRHNQMCRVAELWRQLWYVPCRCRPKSRLLPGAVGRISNIAMISLVKKHNVNSRNRRNKFNVENLYRKNTDIRRWNSLYVDKLWP